MFAAMPSLHSLFLFLAVIGGAVALLQAAGSLVGIGAHDVGDVGHEHALDHIPAPGGGDAASTLDAFNFRSIRAISAGVSFTGIGGLLALRQFGGALALALALLLGTIIYLFVAFVMRSFARLEKDNTVHPLRAVGLEGTVSIPIPPHGGGPGKVTLVVAGRLVEWPAVQPPADSAGATIPSGTPVQVVDADDDTTLTVVQHSLDA